MLALERVLSKMPVIVIAFAYAMYMAYGYYDWLKDPGSEYIQTQSSIAQMRTQVTQLNQQLVQAKEFMDNLNVLRAKIRQLVEQLDNSKTTLSNELDLANFVRMITLEAKKLTLGIRGIKPESEQKRDYYVEIPFTISLRGAYVQMLVFFDRISKLQQVIRVSDFTLKPSGNTFTKYVELEGTAKIVTFKYLGTQADDIAKTDVLKDSATSASPQEGGI